MNYYRVKIGYGNDDFIAIDETEVSKALKAQINGSIALFKEGSIAGNNIISILPDYNRAMGYKRDYKLTGEDYDYIGQKRVDEHRHFLEEKTAEIQMQLSGNNNKLLN